MAIFESEKNFLAPGWKFPYFKPMTKAGTAISEVAKLINPALGTAARTIAPWLGNRADDLLNLPIKAIDALAPHIRGTYHQPELESEFDMQPEFMGEPAANNTASNVANNMVFQDQDEY